VTIPRTYPKMDREIIGILREGNQASQYAAQRIVELEAENERLELDRDRYQRRFGDAQSKLGEWQEFTGFANPSSAGKEIERLQAEAARLQEAYGPSQIPCCKCGGPVVEFSVPNDAWNTIVRKDGPETNQEYLCLGCFAEAAANEIERLRAVIDQIKAIRLSSANSPVSELWEAWQQVVKIIETVKEVNDATI